jgi:hypothetical protein
MTHEESVGIVKRVIARAKVPIVVAFRRRGSRRCARSPRT